MKPGDIVTGVVKEITPYGAFIRLSDRIDALLHITDMSWRRVSDPGWIATLGETLTVKILASGRSNDGKTWHYSVGLKQMTDDPWPGIHERCPIGQPTAGEITHSTDYGLFVRICPSGVEGLVHVKTMTNNIESYSEGQMVVVVPIKYTNESQRAELVLEKDYKHE